jgi:hypothetical protein
VLLLFLLNRVQCTLFRNSFYHFYGLALHLGGEYLAGTNQGAVQDNGTGSAITGGATRLGVGELGRAGQERVIVGIESATLAECVGPVESFRLRSQPTTCISHSTEAH